MEPDLTRRLKRLGVDLDSIGALLLLPLVEVAWADGEIQPEEQRRIMTVAQAWEAEEESKILLRSWLRYAPTPAYCERGREALADLLATGSQAEGPWNPDRLLEEATAVAAAAGGWLPFLRVSASERQVIHKIEHAFGRVTPSRPQERAQAHPDLDRAVNAVTLDFDTTVMDIEASGGVLIPDFARNTRFNVPREGIVVGNGEAADLRVVDCEGLAPNHCRLSRRGTRFYVQEMGGETRVNGE
ncbi:MAG: TerB family tellurite resistance protein, partial [Myxococcales bacterium]|nr:TerB family tellurite resistance protein [Myxococcales bacterium]